MELQPQRSRRLSGHPAFHCCWGLLTAVLSYMHAVTSYIHSKPDAQPTKSREKNKEVLDVPRSNCFTTSVWVQVTKVKESEPGSLRNTSLSSFQSSAANRASGIHGIWKAAMYLHSGLNSSQRTRKANILWWDDDNQKNNSRKLWWLRCYNEAAFGAVFLL